MKMFSFFIKFILVLIIILFMSSILYSNYEKGKGISSDKEILQVTDKTFYDSSGIISILCENFETAENWEKKHYYTGKGIKAILSSEKLSYADYRISISREGEYNLFILGNKRPYSESSDNVISFQVSKDGTEFEEQEQIMFNDLNVPSWSSISLINKGSNGRLIFKEPGVYILRLVPVKGYNFFLEKILLSNNSYLPYGIGPEQTITGVNFKEGFDEMIIIPPAWAFGVLYGGYTDQKETLEIVDRLIREDYPVDAYWIDSWFWNFKNKGSGPDGYISFIEDKTAFPDLEEMWSYFQKRNVKSGIWIWDCILRNGNEDVYENFKKRGFFSKTYIEKGKWHNKIGNTECGNIDFQNSEAVIYWKQMIKPFFDRGLDFLKLDRTSEIPYCKAAFEATGELGKETGGRGFILAHLHTTYDSRYKLYPAKWTGDAKICWSQPNYPDLSVYAMGGLKENIGMVSDCKRSTYDIPFLTHDCGGYNYFGSKDFSDELYARWVQFASMNTIMTIFSTQENPSKNHPYNFSAETQNIFRKYTHLRMKLFPYIYTCALNTRLTGKKMIEGDGVHEYQYFFGPEILVAPVFEKGVTKKEVYLPEGSWIDFETDRVYSGEKIIVIDAPLDKIPIMVRGGAIIPFRNYERSIERGTNNHITLEIYPVEKESYFTMLEDDGRSNDYLSGCYCSTVFTLKKNKKDIMFLINSVEGKFKGMIAERKWTVNFHLITEPSVVKINNNKVDFNYDREKQLLSISCESSTDKLLEILIHF